MSHTAIVNNLFRTYTAQKFIEGLLETQLSSNNLFLWVGKTTSWGDGDTPQDADDTIASRIASYADMMAMKKVSPSDTCLVVPRHDWTASTVYTPYDQFGAADSQSVKRDQFDPETNLPPFYVITDEYNVYKCLGNAGGAASSVKPTGTSTTRFTTGDGYVWKFMFQVSSADIQKFLTASWIPVREIATNDGSYQWAVQQSATPGTIDRIDVSPHGAGWTTATATIHGDGTGATATVTCAGGHVTAITVTNPGSRYTYATLEITGDGSGFDSDNYDIIISPPEGHGASAIVELGAMYVMVSVQLQYDEAGKITVSNDYRKFGLIVNPKKFGSQILYTSLVAVMTTNLTLTGVSGTFNADDQVVGATSGATARVVDYNSSTHVLRLIEVQGTFQNEIVNDTDSSASGSVTAIVKPDVQPNTGWFLTTEHVSPIARAADELEGFKTVLTF